MYVESSPQRVGSIARWAWLPIPALLLATLIAWAVGPDESYSGRGLTLIFELVFMTLASLAVAYFLVRSFFASGAPGLLLLACGIVLWGLSGVAAGAFSHGDVNQSITIHNLCVWLSAACHLGGALLGAQTRTFQQRGWWLLAAFSAVLAAVAFVILAAMNGWTPIFFADGGGGTWVRQTLLGSAIATFIVSGMILVDNDGEATRAFSSWYGLGLLLMAVGLLGVLMQSVHSSVVGWTAAFPIAIRPNTTVRMTGRPPRPSQASASNGGPVSPDRFFAIPNETDAIDAIAAMAISTEMASAQDSRTRMIKQPEAAPRRSTP